MKGKDVDRTAWVKDQLLQILSGKTTTVIQTLESLAQDPSTAPTQRGVLNITIGYYRRNRSAERSAERSTERSTECSRRSLRPKSHVKACPTCAMISTWIEAGLSAAVSLKERVVIWSRTAWNSLVYAGRNRVPRPSWSCRQCASMMTGRRINVFAARANINDSTVLTLTLHRCPRLLC